MLNLEKLEQQLIDALDKETPESIDAWFKQRNYIPMIQLYVYFKNGNVFSYPVESAIKAREHAEKIWTTGFRTRVGDRHEWFGPHYIDKIAWDGPDTTPLAIKYDE